MIKRIELPLTFINKMMAEQADRDMNRFGTEQQFYNEEIKQYIGDVLWPLHICVNFDIEVPESIARRVGVNTFYVEDKHAFLNFMKVKEGSGVIEGKVIKYKGKEETVIYSNTLTPNLFRIKKEMRCGNHIKVLEKTYEMISLMNGCPNYLNEFLSNVFVDWTCPATDAQLTSFKEKMIKAQVEKHGKDFDLKKVPNNFVMGIVTDKGSNKFRQMVVRGYNYEPTENDLKGLQILVKGELPYVKI